MFLLHSVGCLKQFLLFLLHLSLGLFQQIDALFHRMIERVFDLQLVLVVGVSVTQMAKLFGLIKAPFQVLRGYEILGNFDAVVNVSHLQKRQTKL